jgi:hypothetical protein
MLLQEADNFLLGTENVSRLYMGETLVWPVPSGNLWQFTDNPSCKILSGFRAVYQNGNVFADWGDGNISGINSNVNYTHVFQPCSSSSSSSIQLFYNFTQKITGVATGSLYGVDIDTNNDGTILIIGGPSDDQNGLNAGAVLIYTGSAQQGWSFKQKLLGDFNQSGYGRTVSINNDGTILAICRNNNTLTDNGKVFIYTGSPQNGWTLKQQLSGGSPQDSFGSHAHINGDGTVLIIGAFGDDEGGFEAGAAFVYTGSSQNVWTLKQKLIGDSVAGFYGFSVTSNKEGTVLLMGGYADDAGGINAGAALVYTGSSQNGWVLKQKLLGDKAGELFGTSVCTNSDGTILALGGGEFLGQGLIYTGSAQQGWSFKQKLTGVATDFASMSIDINSNGTVILIGGGRDNDGGINAGAAIVYTGDSTAGWKSGQKLIGDNPDSRYGSKNITVSSDGTILMMGGYLDDAGGTNAGAVLIYKLN